MTHAILLISCGDNKGITATVTSFVFTHNGNIVHADQHIDEQSNTFFMRIEWSLENFALERDQISAQFEPIAARFNMKWSLHFTDEKQKVAVFVSKHMHCLMDVLLRHKDGQLDCEIPLIISNHPDAKKIADSFQIPFHEYPITKENKIDQEKKELVLLKEHSIDLIILARYHQVLSSHFVYEYHDRIINIHHSFLPAFAGKSPYAQAYAKGVKIIGATSHYVTEALDEGPIIEQSTTTISHRDSLGDLIRKGEDLERMVLSRAVRWHLERKILSYNNKTVIFD